VILGGVHGVVESLFRRYTRNGMRSAAAAAQRLPVPPALPPTHTTSLSAAAPRPMLCHRSLETSYPAPTQSTCPLSACFLIDVDCFLLPRSDEDAFKQSVESITGPITRIISRDGMLGVYEQVRYRQAVQGSTGGSRPRLLGAGAGSPGAHHTARPGGLFS
jgi:hypothetical protein